MPIFLRTLGYKIYFWSNEGNEPIHFHVTKSDPSPNDTKIWILSDSTFLVAHNKGRIPEKDLSRIVFAMKSFYFDFINFWKAYFDSEVKFYK